MEQLFIGLIERNFADFSFVGYLIIFILCLLESIPILGMLIPGQTIAILSGFIAKVEVVGFLNISLTIFLGALIGDVISFFLGKKYGESVKSIKYKNFEIKKEYVDKIRELILEHPIKSILLGRINSLTRSIFAFIAGSTAMKKSKFFAISIVGAFLWAFASTGIGFVFGQGVDLIASIFGKFIVVASIITLIIIWIVKYTKKTKQRIPISDIYLSIISISSLFVFSVIAEILTNAKDILKIDLLIKNFFAHNIGTNLYEFMVWLTVLGEQNQIIVFSTLFAIWLFLERKFIESVVVIWTMFTGGIFINLAKAIFLRPRPDNFIPETLGSSFPSGHAAMSIMLGVLLIIYLIPPIESKRNKIIFSCLIGIFSILIGFSRIYLGVHWTSDVVAGFAAGLWWATFVILISRVTLWIIRRSNKRHELPNIQ